MHPQPLECVHAQRATVKFGLSLVPLFPAQWTIEPETVLEKVRLLAWMRLSVVALIQAFV